MIRKKTMPIEPHFKPMTSGLADYTTLFCHELVKTDDIVLVTKLNNGMVSSNSFSNIIHFNCFNLITVFKCLLYLLRNPQDRLIIQYVPYMYGRAGLNFSLPFFVILIKLLFPQMALKTIFHELWYPFILREWKSWILHPIQRLMASVLILCSDDLYCSSGFFVNLIQELYPLKKDSLFHLPVPSNIMKELKGETSISSAFLERWRSLKEKTQGRIKIVHFGSLHSSKDSINVFKEISKLNLMNMSFVFVGLNEDEMKQYINNEQILRLLRPHSSFLGKIKNDEVELVFKESDLMIAYFIDGASTRRGSLMAAMNIGLPCLTTISENTEKSLVEAPLFFAKNNTAKFAQCLERLVSDQGLKKADRHQLSQYYDRHFGWDKVITPFR